MRKLFIAVCLFLMIFSYAAAQEDDWFWDKPIVGITFIVKLFLYFYVKSVIRNKNSPALKANLQDHFS